MTEQQLSALFGVPLEGYASDISVAAGDTVQFMLSGPEGDARLSVARLIHGDPHPAGPGYRDSMSDWGRPRTLALRTQHLDLGSYVEIPNDDALNPTGAFTLGLWFYPTLLDGGWQTLATKSLPGNFSYGLYLIGYNTIVAGLSRDGTAIDWCSGPAYVEQRAWQFVALTFEPATGEICVHQWLPTPEPNGESSRKSVPPGPVHAGEAPLLFGATPSWQHPGRHLAHFNGKIGDPLLLARAVDADEVSALTLVEESEALGPVLANWDFGRDVSGSRVVDVSGNEIHGVAVNAPARAVTGPGWNRSPKELYTENPAEYNAIHLHEDDLDDARWEVSHELRIPEESISGIYAAYVENANDRLYLPFVVRPRSPRSGLGFLAPTLTWRAYTGNRLAYSHTEDGVVDRGLSLYDIHRDGSMVYYCSGRKPSRAWNPTTGFQHWGAHTITADLYLVDWLERHGIEHDVLADEDLHREGASLLEPYRCVILGSHPEYWTRSMIDAFRSYVRSGGRALYLGGNGLYWTTSVDCERPYLMEVRKTTDGDVEPWVQPAPGEAQHSTTLEVGGLWARNGIPPRSLVGVEYAGTVFTPAGGGWGFQRLPASWEERYAFIFEGVEDEVIGDFGLNVGSAAGYEMDAVQDWQWDDETERILLARATDQAFNHLPHTPVTPAADITLLSHPGGGGVFAAGSVTWTGSLSHNDYDNSVSRITGNVIRHFLGVPRGESLVNQVVEIAEDRSQQ